MMKRHNGLATLLGAATLALAAPVAVFAATGDGIVRVESAYSVEETISLIKADIADKGILFFDEIDQAALAGQAGIELPPSTLLIFGNPPLGAQFLTSNPESGLDWPVRLLVREDEAGRVWAVYTDFAWIADRFGIDDREAQFKMASEVIGSITHSISGD